MMIIAKPNRSTETCPRIQEYKVLKSEVIPKSNMLIGTDVLGKEGIPVSVLVDLHATKNAA